MKRASKSGEGQAVGRSVPTCCSAVPDGQITAWAMRNGFCGTPDVLRLCFEDAVTLAKEYVPEISVSPEMALLIRRAFLPANPNKMRNAAPEVVAAAKEFIRAVEAYMPNPTVTVAPLVARKVDGVVQPSESDLKK